MKKIKKWWQINFIRNSILFSIPLFLIELLFRLISKLSVFSYDFLRITLGVFFLAFLFSFILEHLPKIVAKIWNIIILLIIAIYGIAELGFNNFLGVYASLQIKTQASAVENYVWEFIRSFKISFYTLLIPVILLIVYYIFVDKRITLDMPKLKRSKKAIIMELIKFLTIVLVGGAYYATLKIDFMQDKLQSTSTYSLFLKPSNPGLVVRNFGITGFGILDIREYFIPGKDASITVSYDASKIDLNSGKAEDQKQLTIDNETWTNIIENEEDETLNTLNKYFISKDASTTNEFTGLFKGKNLIIIMLESGSNLILNEEYYPNMAKLYNNGWSWNNYYSPRNSCATGNNETSGMTSLYTIYNNCTVNIYKNNTYFESIFNLYKNRGYSTSSYHNWNDRYYYRTTIHKNMGSDNFYKITDMNIPFTGAYGDWTDDSDLMKFYLSKLDERDDSKPFMSWITTVSSHQPYSDHSGANDTYLDLFPSSIPSDVRKYMSKLKVVDNAIGVLLDGLEERGLLEDTVIALYCDHYPYAISTDNLNEVFSYDTSIDHNAEQVPFIIYNPSLEKKTFNDYATYVDLTPTLANLFNLEFDSRIYMGTDLLSKESENIAIFADGSWKNDKAYYNASTGKIKYYTENVYNEEEILAINSTVSLKLKMSSLAIKNNYFSYLEKKLNTISIEN